MPPMRLALAPLNPIVGDIAHNAGLIRSAIARAREAGADLVVCPELAICGYPPRDLLLQDGFVAAGVDAAREIGENHTRGITAVFGTVLPRDAARPKGPLANSLLAYRDGQLLAYYDKRLLPTYDVFDEDRYFEPGDAPAVIEVAGVKIGLAICEDLWKGDDAGFSSRYANVPDPVKELVAKGATLILAPSASPFVLGKTDKHRAIIRRHALAHAVHVVSLNQLGGNDELVFDGHAMAYDPGGVLLAHADLFRGGLTLIDLAAPRALPEPSPDPEALLFDALVLGIRDYLAKTGFRSAILGLSGGIDSALTAALAVAALGSANVRGVAMPGAYSSEHSKEDALDLAQRLGIPCPMVPIDPPVRGFRAVLDPAFESLFLAKLGEKLPDLAEENLQSRIRGTLLMALSNRSGALVLTTGNKSELAVGYCTLYGDMNGGLAVLSDVSKQWVYRLSRWINAHHASRGFARPPIPERSIVKPPSAELRPNQTDQDSLPPYEVLDEIIERYVERRQSPATIAHESDLDAPTVARCVRMIDLSEYKRRQAAIGLKVTSVAFGTGRRFPVAQRWRPSV